jgi:uncharacterized protein YcbX
MATNSVLKQIFIYPVKSLAGIEVKEWQVTETGLLHDRKWMLIDEQQQFLSQRKLPRMALIKTALTAQELVLSAPGMDDIKLPLHPNGGEIIPSQVWHDNCQARSVSAEVDNWFSEFLKTPCRLVYLPDDVIRLVNPHYALPNDRTGFSDAFPFMILSDASLTALNQAMGLNLSMQRFRPNLVISGCDSYAEDSWRQIRIGEIDFRLPKPCSRCAVPAIDPQTAQIGKEPLLTLNRLRKWQNKVYFGQNALHDSCGVLTVGDVVTVKRVGELQPPL